MESVENPRGDVAVRWASFQQPPGVFGFRLGPAAPWTVEETRPFRLEEGFYPKLSESDNDAGGPVCLPAKERGKGVRQAVAEAPCRHPRGLQQRAAGHAKVLGRSLINVLGIPSNTIDSFVDFERKVRAAASFVFVSDHNFLCEQKSWGIDLDKPEPRNGGMETPLQQAMWYARTCRTPSAPAG